MSLELFPLTKEQMFKLPQLSIGADSHSDTYKGFFMNEVLALETSAKRNLAPTGYARRSDGNGNLSLPDTILDVSSFYLFAHKTLVSTIFILAKTVPRPKARGIQFNSFTKFRKSVEKHDTELLELLYRTCGKDLTWAQRAIIDKRDDLVQHWQGNATNKLFPMIIIWDVPYLVYYNSEHKDSIDVSAVDTVLARARGKIKAQIDPAADPLQKIAWLEAWQPSVSSGLQQDIDSLRNDDYFITLPVTAQLCAKLDKLIASLLKTALDISEGK